MAEIAGEEDVFHRSSLLYLYRFGGRIHAILRAKAGFIKSASFVLEKPKRLKIPMVRKAEGVPFDYFEAVVHGIEGELEYRFIIDKASGSEELGPFTSYARELEAPNWPLESVFYQIMPDRFAGGFEKSNLTPGERFHGGDLVGLRNRIDHLRDLGINALYLTPIFESMTYHGYDIIDYHSVAERLGGDKAFGELLASLNGAGIRLVLDGVFHHTSFFHPWFQDLIKNGEKSRYKDFYRVTGFPVVSDEFMETLLSDEPWVEKYTKLKKLGWNYESFFSVWLMPRLNHENPEVKKFVTEVMNYWIERGADGWRLDVAHGVPPDFWGEIRKGLPREAYLFGEVMDDSRLYLFDKFHGVMNYALYDAVLRFFVFEEITAEEFLNELELISAHYGPAEHYAYNFLDNHDTERFIDLVGGDKRRYLCALTFLLTYKGIPSIFYGDEIGLGGSGEGMGAGRTPMPWDRSRWDEEILRATKELIRLRRSSRALQIGEFLPIHFRGRSLIYTRVHRDEKIVVGINCSSKALKIDLPGIGRLEIGPFSSRVIQ
ncbi:glycoside hydrolase family 13 protein [Thermococcus profundus]|uniref:glycoside hydrolase family 13 protein n=1 Tax=Thermococcus profundus TaxID=49899 RepID=UPI0030039F22